MGKIGRKFKPGKPPGKKIKYTTATEKAIIKFRNSKRWKVCRLAILADRPLCEYPKCGKAGVDVHHVITLAEDMPYMENATCPDNLKSICKVCHGKITALENMGLDEKAKAIFNEKKGE